MRGHPGKMTAIRHILALLYERGAAGLTAHEASDELGIKYNTAGVSLERLRAQEWCVSRPSRDGKAGRPVQRFYIAGKEGA